MSHHSALPKANGYLSKNANVRAPRSCLQSRETKLPPAVRCYYTRGYAYLKAIVLCPRNSGEFKFPGTVMTPELLLNSELSQSFRANNHGLAIFG